MGKKLIDPKGIRKFTFVQKMNEIGDSRLATSIVNQIWEGRTYEFTFLRKNGELATRTYRVDSRQASNGSVSLGKILLNDGTWTYALIGTRESTCVVRKELVSIYASKLRNPNTGEWEWPSSLYWHEPDEEIVKKLMFYNESVDAALSSNDLSMLKFEFGTKADYGRIYQYTHSGNRWIRLLPMGEFPENESICGLGERTVAERYTHGTDFPSGFGRWSGLPPRFFTWKKSFYVKSVYRDVVKTKLKREIYPIEDLIMVRSTGSRTGDDELKTVWTSLDATCKGNV